MKKPLVIVLTLGLTLAALAGCKDDDTNIYTEASYDSVSEFVPDSVSREETENSDSLTGEFVVKEKKYVFEGNDLVVVSVENNTNKNYSVTITGTYLDAEGKVLKTETQTFDQYSAGYHGYFLFQPNIKFDLFKYTVETKETDGPFYAKDIGFKFNGLQETKVTITEEEMKDNFTKYPTILASFSHSYSGDTKVQAYIKWFLINEKDEIIAVVFKAPWLEPNQSLEGESHHIMYQTMDEDFEWPEAWEGTIRALPIVEKVDPNIT